jgi:hypothetical protein
MGARTMRVFSSIILLAFILSTWLFIYKISRISEDYEVVASVMIKCGEEGKWTKFSRKIKSSVGCKGIYPTAYNKECSGIITPVAYFDGEFCGYLEKE